MPIKSADEYFQKSGPFQDLIQALRQTVLANKALQETVKWGGPVYTLDGKNIVGIAAFKNHAALWFFQGALLSDPENVLINAQEGKTKAMLQWRFTNKKDIKKTLIKRYVAEAIKNQLQGLEIKPDRNTKPLEIPELLGKALVKEKGMRQAFLALTRGKQKEYCAYIVDAKREETKHKRVEKILPMIKQGIGLNDKYR